MVIAADASVADWVAAVGQVAGAVFTAVAVGVALHLARRDSKWRKAEQADRDAAQARLVAVEPEYAIEYSPIKTMLNVLNGSMLPVLDVKIVEVVNADASDGHTWRIDSHGPMGDYFPTEARVLASGATFTLPVEYVDSEGRPVQLHGMDHVTFEFTDAAGFRWRRQDNDPPVRLLDEPSPTRKKSA